MHSSQGRVLQARLVAGAEYRRESGEAEVGSWAEAR